MNNLQPIYLLADSQLLFWQINNEPFLTRITEQLDRINLKAAYIGASNGNVPEFYKIFLAAMESIDIAADECKMISASYDKADEDFLAEADIILLAGGDVSLGWKTFQASGMDKDIQQRYHDGCLIIGISAGAIQLGMCFTDDSLLSDNQVVSSLKIIPLVIGVHEEEDSWRNLKKLTSSENGFSRGIGLPSGGGLIFHSDHSVEPIRYPLKEFLFKSEENKIEEALIHPVVDNNL